MRSRLLVWTSLIACVACGPGAPPEEPTIFLDRTKLGFNQEFDSATFIGTTTFNTVLVRNDGVQDLVLSNVSISGNRFNLTGPDVTTLGYRKTSIIQVAFVPTAPQLYTGTVTITSNAANTPTATIELVGCGVNSVGTDLSYCQNSGDF